MERGMTLQPDPRARPLNAVLLAALAATSISCSRSEEPVKSSAAPGPPEKRGSLDVRPDAVHRLVVKTRRDASRSEVEAELTRSLNARVLAEQLFFEVNV